MRSVLDAITGRQQHVDTPDDLERECERHQQTARFVCNQVVQHAIQVNEVNHQRKHVDTVSDPAEEEKVFKARAQERRAIEAAAANVAPRFKVLHATKARQQAELIRQLSAVTDEQFVIERTAARCNVNLGESLVLDDFREERLLRAWSDRAARNGVSLATD